MIRWYRYFFAGFDSPRILSTGSCIGHSLAFVPLRYQVDTHEVYKPRFCLDTRNLGIFTIVLLKNFEKLRQPAETRTKEAAPQVYLGRLGKKCEVKRDTIVCLSPFHGITTTTTERYR